MRRPLRERVLSRLIIDPSGCVLWTGFINRYGYGQLTVKGKNHTIHRLMYEWFVGPVPEGLELDHLCRVRHCAAPGHLEAVTGRVNGLRGQGAAALNVRKIRCDNGHEFDLLNTYWRPNGSRGCRQCNLLAVRRYKARKQVAARGIG